MYKTLLSSTPGLVTRISDFCNSGAGFSRTSMSDLGPTTQMTITRFRESLLDRKNSLVSISLMARLLFSAFFFPGICITPFADHMISEPPINSRKNIIHDEVVVQVNL